MLLNRQFLTPGSIYQMQVEHESAAIEIRMRAARAFVSKPASSLQIEGRMPVLGTGHGVDAGVPEPEVEEPGDEPKDQTINSEDERTEDVLADDDFDGDPTHDTALTLCEDLASLQNKVSRFAKSALRPPIVHQPQLLDSQSTTGSISTSAPFPGTDRSQSPMQQAEDPVYFQDLLLRKFVFPFEQCQTWSVSWSSNFFLNFRIID